MAFNLVLVLLSGVVLSIVYQIWARPKDKYLAQFPQAIEPDSYAAAFKSRCKTTLGNVISTIDVGYEKFSKLNLPFYLPGLQSNYVILPPSDVKWLGEQPETIISADKEQNFSLQTRWTFLDPGVMANPFHVLIVKREMTRQIGNLIPEAEDELEKAMNESWGMNTEWKDIGLFDTMIKVIARASNRVLVGSEVCRNEEYLTNCANFAQDISITASILRIFPDWSKTFVAPLVTFPTRLHVRRAAKHLMPVVKSRIANLNSLKEEDFLTWCIREAAISQNAKEELDPYRLVLRIMTINFAAIHTSSFTITNLLLDFFSSDTAASAVQILRTEMETVYSENGNKWDKASLAKLVKTDSALRESMRISTFMTHGMDRIIAAKEGVTTPSGVHVDEGGKVGAATFAIHHDNDFYPSAKTYQPFRFSEARESLQSTNTTDSAQGQSSETRARILESKQMAAVTTNDHFLAFGAGKHACPGRFFASAEIKMMFAFIVMNYDIEPFEKRPENSVFGAVVVPPVKATIRVRRRK